jgi:hypothetical protein
MRIVVAGLAALAVTVAGGGSRAKANVASPDAAALTAADAYIQQGRRGTARVRIAGVAPGTPVRARLTRHAFHFGINVTDVQPISIEGAPPAPMGALPALRARSLQHQMPSNAGKWILTGRPRVLTMDYIDLILLGGPPPTFARMHTLFWTRAAARPSHRPTGRGRGDAAAKADLLRAIDRRVDYYVRDRAGGY